jgi:hypothetical protein
MRALIAAISVIAIQAAASFPRLGDDFHHDIDDTVVSAGEAHTCVIRQSGKRSEVGRNDEYPTNGQPINITCPQILNMVDL